MGDTATQERSVMRGSMFDGIVNTVSGQGTARDVGAHTHAMPVMLTTQESAILYKYYWLARKVVDIPVQDMLKNGRTITSLTGSDLEKYEKAWSFYRVGYWLGVALKWSRLYGGGAIIPIGSNQALNRPYNPAHFKSGALRRLIVLDATELSVDESTNYISDLTSEFFKMPERMQYQAQEIDISNVVVVHGACQPNNQSGVPDSMQVADFWGGSILHPLKNPILDAHSAYSSVASMIQANNIDILKMPRLYESLLACGDTSEQVEIGKAVSARAAMFAQFKSMFNVAMIDSEEDVERMKYDFTALAGLLQELVVAVGGGADIPITRLAGRSPGGLNSTGDSDLTNYYNGIDAKQNEELPPLYQLLDRYMTLNVFGDEREIEYTINPPSNITEQERSEMNERDARSISLIGALNVVPESVLARHLQQGVMPTITDEYIQELVEVEALDDENDLDDDPLDEPEDNSDE